MATEAGKRATARFIKRHGKSSDVKRKSRTADGQGGYTEGFATVEQNTPIIITQREGQERDVIVGDSETAFVDHDGMALPDITVDHRDWIFSDGRRFQVISIGNTNKDQAYTALALEEKQSSE